MPKFQPTDQTLQLIIDAIPIGVLAVDLSGEIVFSNQKIEKLLGYNAHEFIGLSVHNLVPENLREAHKKMLDHYCADPSPRPMHSGRILPAMKKNKQEISVQIGLMPLVIDETNYVVVSMIETTNEILKVASYSDALTGLPNRTLFNEVSESLRNLAIRNKNSLALIFIDLDNFKNVNDQFGHDIGDLVLSKVADVCSKNIRKNDIIGRVGGDEFIVCMYGIGNSAHLDSISNKLAKEVASINEINNHVIDIGASIGAIFVNNPADLAVADMINIADKLMYKAKKSGKGTAFTEEYLALEV